MVSARLNCSRLAQPGEFTLRDLASLVIDAIQRERTDEYHEVVGSTRQFHEELRLERRRGRATYTELEEADEATTSARRVGATTRVRDTDGASAALGCFR